MTEERDLFYEYYNETGEWANDAAEVNNYFGGGTKKWTPPAQRKEYDVWRNGRNKMSGESLEFWEFDASAPPETPPMGLPGPTETLEQRMYRELQDRLKAMDLAAAETQKEVMRAAGTPYPEAPDTPMSWIDYRAEVSKPRQTLWETLDKISKHDSGRPTSGKLPEGLDNWAKENIYGAVKAVFDSPAVQAAKGSVAKAVKLGQQGWEWYVDFINMPWYMQRQMMGVAYNYMLARYLGPEHQEKLTQLAKEHGRSKEYIETIPDYLTRDAQALSALNNSDMSGEQFKTIMPEQVKQKKLQEQQDLLSERGAAVGPARATAPSNNTLLSLPDLVASALAQEERSWGDRWAEAEGFRLTHIFRPDKTVEYAKLRGAGKTPQQAGAATEEWYYELAGDVFLDPFNILPEAFSKVIYAPINAALTPVKWAGNWAVSKSAKLSWLVDASRRTQMQLAYSAPVDVFRYVRVKNPGASVDEIVSIIKNPSPGFLEEAGEYFGKEIGVVQKYIDEAEHVANNWKFGDDLFAKDLDEETITLLKRMGASDDVIEHLDSHSDFFVDVFGDKVGKRMVERVDEEWVTAAKQVWGEKIGTILDKGHVGEDSPKIMKWMSGTRRFLTESWLGLRPAWTIGNLLDNAWKGATSGVNVFRNLADDWAYFTKHVGPVPQEALGSFAGYMHAGVRESASEAKSSFLREIWNAVKEKQKPNSVFREVGATPLAWASEKNFALSGAIEEGSRARIFLSKFWEPVDEFWAGINKLSVAKMAPEYSALVSNMNPATATFVEKSLRGAYRWNADDIDALIAKVNADELVLSRSTDIIAEAGDELKQFEQGHIFTTTRDKLLDLEKQIKAGGVVSDADIDSVFDGAYHEVEKVRNAYFDKLMSNHQAKYIQVPDTADGMVNGVLTAERKGSAKGLHEAWQDLDAYQLSFEHSYTAAQNKVWRTKWEGGYSGEAFGEAYSQFAKEWQKKWADFHKNYNDAQAKLAAEFRSVGAELPPSTLSALREASLGMDEMWKKQFMIQDSWMLRVRRAKSERQKSKLLSQMSDELSANNVRGVQLKTLRDSAQSTVTQRLVDAGKMRGEDMTRVVGRHPWDSPIKEIQRMTKEADRYVKKVSKDLDDWFMASRTKAAQGVQKAVPQTAAQKAAAVDFLKEIKKGYIKQQSNAMTYAVKETNRILFDYTRTSNFEDLLANGLMPFYKWQMRNIPFWTRTFVEKPTIIETVYDVKRLINDYNEEQGIPTRLRDTIAIPGGERILEFLEKRSFVGKYLADMQTQIRWNPFVFGPSIIQQTLAWSSFEERQLMETLEAEDPELYKLYVVGQQAGFNLWPWHEWFLAMAFPETFDDWYPDALLSDGYTIEWLANEYLHKPNINPDRMYRNGVSAIFSFMGSPKDYAPDKFLTYNTGREVRAMAISGMPDDPELARKMALWKMMASALVNKFTAQSVSFMSEYELVERALRAEKKALINNAADIYTEDEAREMWYNHHPEWRKIDQTWNTYPFTGDQNEAERLQEEQRITDLRIEYFDKRKRLVKQRETAIDAHYAKHPLDKYGAGFIYDEYTKLLDDLSTEYKGKGVNFTWEPSGNTVDEIIQSYQSTIFRMVSADSFPSRDQYSDMQGVLDGKAYFKAQEEWRDNLITKVMKLPAILEMEEALVAQGLAHSDVEDLVNNLFTETSYDEWRRNNDTMMEALNEAAYQYVYNVANQEWQEAAGKEGEDEKVIKARRDAVLARWSGVPANELVDEVYAMYPNRWSKLELLQAYEGLQLPSLSDSWWINKTGRNRLIAMTQNKYYSMSSLDKKNVREAFGKEFGEAFLNPEGDLDLISNQRIGEWLNGLEEMLGEEKSQFWYFKGVEGVQPPQKETDLKRFGVEMADPALSKEYDEAVALNDQYWLAIEANDQKTQDKIEEDKRWATWFGSKPKSLFWKLYYDSIPPGVYGRDIRDEPVISAILEKGVRGYLSEGAYTEAIELMNTWLDTADTPGTPEEWKQAKAEYTQYMTIPDDEAHKEDRKRFMVTHPIMAFYYGTTKVREAVAESQDSLWASVTSLAGDAIFDLTDELVGFWAGVEPLSAEATRYISFLHKQVAPKVEFKDFLDILRDEYIQVYEDSYGKLSWGEEEEDEKKTAAKKSTGSSYTRYAATPAKKQTAFRRPTEPRIAMPWRSATTSTMEPRMRIRR